MKKIENFMLPEHTNRMYKEEAISSVSLTRDVADKINELIDSYNQLAEVDLTWKHEQEGRIRKGVLYMKDNLLNSLNDLMVLLRDNGFIDDRIEYHCKNLSTRLDNLLGVVKEGSSSLDAELIDIRTALDGVVYASAGTAIRKQFAKRSDIGFVIYDGEPVATFAQTEVDTTVTLTLNAQLTIFFNNERITVPACEVSYVKDSVDVNLFNIVYDCANEKLSICYSYEQHNDNQIIVGWLIRNKVFFNGYGSLLSWTPDSYKPKFVTTWHNKEGYYFTDDNGDYVVHIPMMFIYYNSTVSVIAEQEITVKNASNTLYKLTYDLRNKTINVVLHNEEEPVNNVVFGFVNFAYGCVTFLGHNSPTTKQQTPNALILGAGKKYVEFDNVNKTVTFPDNTLVLIANESKFVNLADASENTTVYYGELGTTAVKVYVDKFTGELIARRYNDIVLTQHVLLCSFRTTNGAVSINAPYTWNGIPYNNDVILNTSTAFVKTVNHRGFNTVAPENTLSAYRLSKKNGFEYVECDVQFTNDGVPVLLHDDTIDRTSDGTGAVIEMSYSELLAYDFGSWKNASYAGEKIPTFTEFIKLCRALSLHPYIEIKGTPTQEQVETLVDIVKRHGMINNVTWVSFDAFLLECVCGVDSNARIGYIVHSIDEGVINKAVSLSNVSRETFINTASYNNDEVEMCITANIPLEVWTINDEATINGLPTYITGVTSDYVNASNVLYNNMGV